MTGCRETSWWRWLKSVFWTVAPEKGSAVHVFHNVSVPGFLHKILWNGLLQVFYSNSNRVSYHIPLKKPIRSKGKNILIPSKGREKKKLTWGIAQKIYINLAQDSNFNLFVYCEDTPNLSLKHRAELIYHNVSMLIRTLRNWIRFCANLPVHHTAAQQACPGPDDMVHPDPVRRIVWLFETL